MYSTASVACKNWHPDTTSGTYLPQNTREASYAISPIVKKDLKISHLTIETNSKNLKNITFLYFIFRKRNIDLQNTAPTDHEL